MSGGRALRPETLAAKLAGGHDGEAVVPVLAPGITYARDETYRAIGGRTYSRDENPTYHPAEMTLAALEGGAAARLFASGMAALAALVQALAPGDRILAGARMYYGTARYLQDWAARWGLGVDVVDMTDAAALDSALAAGPVRLVLMETPANPDWTVADIAAVAAAAHRAGAVLAVDSTVATPVLTRPIALGADLVLHSATKYLNGHSDVVAGALVTARLGALWERIGFVRAQGGAVPGAFEAWLLQRGMRTLFLRVRQASAGALAIARRFEADPRIRAVHYPGLPGFPGHAVAARQMEGGFGGMLSIRVRGGAEGALAAAGRMRVFVRATSLGGVESLVEHRHSIEPPGSGVAPDLLRLSIGIEAVEDLIADLDQALAAPEVR